MEDIVRSFNSLPRPQTTPTGLPNHWVFGIRHVPLNPPGDLLIAVHPQSTFTKQAGPAQILSIQELSDRAEAIVPLLLKAFTKGNRDPNIDLGEGSQPWAPWTWAAEEPEMAQAIEAKLRHHGVTDHFCSVGMCTAEEKASMGEAWSRLVETVMELMGQSAESKKALLSARAAAASASSTSVELGDDSQCHSCAKSREIFSAPLKRCLLLLTGLPKEALEAAQAYLPNRSNASGTSTTPSPGAAVSDPDAWTYYNRVAHTVPDAMTLAETTNLQLPSSPNAREGTLKPLRRLVITGKDTPENLQLLFGPNWRKTIPSQHEEQRMLFLLSPPPGSPAYVMNAELDVGAPAWSPRPGSEAERRKMGEVMDMQARVGQRVAQGTSPSNADMMAILTAFGANWDTKLVPYQLAINSMGQGVNLSEADLNYARGRLGH